MSSSSSAFAPRPDHHHYCPYPSEQLCYVHCKFCDTVLAVSVPRASLFQTVTVRCGHCTNLLSVNMQGLLLPTPPPPPPAHQLHLSHTFFSTQNLLDEIRNSSQPPLSSQMITHQQSPNDQFLIPPVRGLVDELLPKPLPAVNRPPEKRQRVPSAYNRFIKEEIQRIKAGNPDISHREAFSAAAKNWAHFPHIHFGLMPAAADHHQPVKKSNLCQQEGDHHHHHDAMVKDGFLAPPNIGLAPYR